jgi:ribosomal protein L14E/L6E/L27E
MITRRENSVGRFAISKSGHDAGECYVIVGYDGTQFVRVANGTNRTIAKPKRKNTAHLSITNSKCDGVESLLRGEPVSSNLKIAERIKAYRTQNKKEG